MVEFRLYIARSTPRSNRAVRDMKALLGAEFQDRYSLEVIDLIANPHRSEDDNIFATPTVVKFSPPPVKKIVGDFSNKENVMKALTLKKESV